MAAYPPYDIVPFSTVVSSDEDVSFKRNDKHGVTSCKVGENASCSTNTAPSIPAVQTKSLEQERNDMIEWEKDVVSSSGVFPEDSHFQFSTKKISSTDPTTVSADSPVLSSTRIGYHIKTFTKLLESSNDILDKTLELEKKLNHSVNKVKEINRHLVLKGRI